MSQTKRIYWIDAQIRAKRFPNAESVVSEFKVSRRTAFKDRDHLRRELHAPLMTDRLRGGWYYSDPTYMIPFLALSEAEAATMRRMFLAAEEYLAPSDAVIVGRLFERLGSDLPTSTLPESIGGAMHLSPEAQASPELLAACRQAVHNRQKLRLHYYSAHRDERQWRTVHPHHLHIFQGEPHLIAWCEWRQDFRQFFLGRIKDWELLEGEWAFAHRHEFDVEAYLRQGLTLQHGKEAVTVRVRFSPYQARWIREREYHPSQQRGEQPDGSLIVTLTVAGTDEAKRWLLAYGAEVEVLEPTALRAEIAEELKKLQKIYGTPPE